MKRIIATVLTSLILFSFGSCNQAVNYTNEKKSVDISDRVLENLGDSVSYSTADNYFLKDYFALPDYVTDHVILFASDSNLLNEFGIFHTEHGKARELSEQLKQYLLDSYKKNHTWYDSYIPNETPKLRDAEIRIYGDYAVYAILSKEERNKVFQVMETELQLK